MAVSVSYGFKLTTRETLTSGTVDVSSPVVNHSTYDESGVLNATSAVPATKYSAFLMTLTAGAYTINLASLTGAGGATIDGTGLRVQCIRVKNLGANSMTFSEGASNGIALSIGTFIVPPSGVSQFFLNDASPDIASGDRTIDVAGTGSQTAEVTLVLG